MTGPKVFVCDGIVPHSKVDFTGPKGVLECDGIVPHSCAGKTLQSCCLKLNFKSEDLVFYSVQCIYSHVYAANENEVVIYAIQVKVVIFSLFFCCFLCLHSCVL